VVPSGKLRSKGRCGVFAGKTAWSSPERLRGEVLTTRHYTNLCLPLHLPSSKLGTCESKIFVRICGYDSNRGVVVYVFNADCHRICVGLLHTTGNYMLRCKVIVNVMVISCIHKHKINLNYKLQRWNGWNFFVEQWAWFVVWLQLRLIRKFRIE